MSKDWNFCSVWASFTRIQEQLQDWLTWVTPPSALYYASSSHHVHCIEFPGQRPHWPIFYFSLILYCHPHIHPCLFCSTGNSFTIRSISFISLCLAKCTQGQPFVLYVRLKPTPYMTPGTFFSPSHSTGSSPAVIRTQKPHHAYHCLITIL